ncbi:hypothetical protein IAT38_006465 [Cryptococcus sp. DSM 104549]
MSFIGAGELEHKIAQLQRQLDHKGHEVNSIKNEQRKTTEDLLEAKKAKETAEYNLRNEADRALKAETTLEAKFNEISQLKLKLSNLESSLTLTSDRLKQEEIEKQRIQSALDETLSAGADGAVKQVKDLQARTKQLEEALKRSEDEKERLKLSQGSSGDGWKSEEPLSRGERNRLMALQNENAQLKAQLESKSSSQPSSSSDFFGAAPPSPPLQPQRGNKRRSLSVSAANDVRELEGQVDTLKTQLAASKRELDKAVNEKLAVEISARKKAERLESELEEAKGELEYYRYPSGGADSKELEKIKKAAQAEKEELSRQLVEKEAEVEKKSEEVKKLGKRVEMVEELERELEKERQARSELEAATPVAQANSDEASAARIRALEAELVKARSSTSSTAISTKAGDSELRQVRRELQKALRDKDYLEILVKENDELLAEKDEEISRMRTAIPLPASPVLGATGDGGMVAALEEEKAALTAELEKQAEEFQVEIREIKGKLEAKSKELLEARKKEEGLQALQAKSQDDVAAATAAREALSADLQSALTDLATQKFESEQHAVELAQAQASLAALQATAGAAQQEAAALAERLHVAEGSIVTHEQAITAAAARRDELEAVLATRSHDDAEYDQMVASLKDLAEQLEGVKAELSEAEGVKAELQTRLEVVEGEVRDAQEEKKVLKEKLGQFKETSKKMETEMVEASSASKRMIERKVRHLEADVESLRSQLDDKIAELAVSTSASRDVQANYAAACKIVDDLQARITELEAAQASQPSESETKERDDLVARLAEEKKGLEEALEAAKRQHEKSLAAASARSESAVTEAQKRVQELDSQVAALQSSLVSAHKQRPSADDSEVRKLEEKIERLRIERDELRHNISFVQNERHFAVRAANSDRESAIEEVQRAREELKHRAVACEKLEGELEEVKKGLEERQNRLDDKVASSASEAVERQELNEQLAALELDLSKARQAEERQLTRVTALETDLETREASLKQAEARVEALQTELSNVLHHMGQMAKLSDPPAERSESRASHKEGSEDADLPTDLARAASGESRRVSHSHTRSRSGVSATMLQNLQTERNLQAKIDRRDTRIAILTNDLNKTKSNLALLQIAQEETMAENAELEEERDRLQAQIDAAQTPQVAPEELQAVVLALALTRQQVQSATIRWHVAQSVLEQSRTAAGRLEAARSAVEEKAAVSQDRIAELESEKATVDSELASAKEQELAARQELTDARAAIDDLQARLSEAENASVTAAESILSLSTVEAQITEKEERVRELKAQNIELLSKLEVAEQRLAEEVSSKEERAEEVDGKIAELEQAVASEKKRAQEAEEENNGLLQELIAAEKVLADGMVEAEVEKQALEVRLNEIIQELSQKDRALEEAVAQTAELKAELEAQKAKVEEASGASQSSQTVVDQLRQDITALQDSTKVVESERDALRDQLAELVEKASSAEKTAEVLGGELTGVRAELEVAGREVLEVKSQLEKAREKVMERDGVIEGLRSEVAQAQEGKEAAEGALAENVQRIENVTEELRIAQESLQASQAIAEASERDAKAAQAELQLLRSVNEKVTAELAQVKSAPASAVDESAMVELEERIKDLEAALTQKNKEVDEADDQTREAFKANAKLERKIGKLQRQLDQAQLDKNTAINKLLSSQPVHHAPTPKAQPAPAPAAPAATVAPVAPVARSMLPPVVAPPAPSPLPTTAPISTAAPIRTPRAMPNIFSPPTSSAPIPTSGHKRHRETDEVQPTKPADAIMLPPSSTSPRKVLGARSAFTPQRGYSAFTPKVTNVVGVNGSQERKTVGAEAGAGAGAEGKRDAMRNIFAKPPVPSDPAKRTAFPLPPTRAPFTNPRSAS